MRNVLLGQGDALGLALGNERQSTALALAQDDDDAALRLTLRRRSLRSALRFSGRTVPPKFVPDVALNSLPQPAHLTRQRIATNRTAHDGLRHHMVHLLHKSGLKYEKDRRR